MLSRNIRNIEKHLTRVMNEKKTDVLETPFGTVARRRDPDGGFRWVVSAAVSPSDFEDNMP